MRIGRRTWCVRMLAGLAVAGVAPVAVAAGQVKLTATLDVDKTRVGDGVRLSLSVQQSGGARASEPTLPAALADNFEVVSSSTSSNFRFGFGGGASGGAREQTTTLMIVPLKAGKFELGFSVAVGGETFKSNRPTLTVSVADAPASSDAMTSGAMPTEPRGEIFLWATTDKSTAYVGEQIVYDLDVYERRQFLNVHLRKPPTFSDFFSEELPQGESEIQTVGDVPYRVEPGVRRALFPQRAGQLTIGSAEISVGMRKRLRSAELTVEILPLPAKGQPPGFSPNNVGDYTIEASVDRTEVDAGEPFTLTITVSGNGNIKFIDPGAWPQVDGVRRYEPKTDVKVRSGQVLGGVRTYEFLMIPQLEGTLTIPPHTLHYFNPEHQAYAQASSKALEIKVGSGATTQAAPAVDAPGSATEYEDGLLAEVIAGDAVPDAGPRTRWLTTTRWVYGMLAVPALASVGLGGAALLRRFGPDEHARGRARDRMRRQLRIKAAEEAVASGEGFHATLNKLLHELAVRRAGADGVGLPRPELLRLLLARDAAEADVEDLRALLDDCDAARFAAQQGSPADRRALLVRALALVSGSTLSKEGSA